MDELVYTGTLPVLMRGSYPETPKAHTMKIKFKSEDGYKSYICDNYEFFATKQGRDGYTLAVYEWYTIEDDYQANRYGSRRVQIPYEAPCSLDRVRERIANFLN